MSMRAWVSMAGQSGACRSGRGGVGGGRAARVSGEGSRGCAQGGWVGERGLHSGSASPFRLLLSHGAVASPRGQVMKRRGPPGLAHSPRTDQPPPG